METFARPRFRSDVVATLGTSTADIDYRSQGCTISFDSEGREDVSRLISSLRTGIDISDLYAECPSLRHILPDTIRELDRLGLLEEAASPAPIGILSGTGLYAAVVSFVSRAEQRICQSRLYEAFENDAATKSNLVRYVIEYFHLVYATPAILGQALAHRHSERTYTLLRTYYAAECNHDQLLAMSLRAIGVEPPRHGHDQPLPATMAIISLLFSLARHDPLSFKAVLFLLERPQKEFHDAFYRRCVALELPAGFYEPILQHSSVNDEGSHDEISQELLEDVAAVTPEEIVTAKRHSYHLLECLNLLEGQILSTAVPAA
jgi:hypothetical protein